MSLKDTRSMIVDHRTLEGFAHSLRSRGKQPATVESYCRDAQRFLEYLNRFKMPPSEVVPDTLVAYQEFLRNDCEERDNSVRRTVIGIRQFYRYLSESQTIKTTPFDMVPIPVRDDRLPKGLAEEDIERLIRTAAAGRPECKAARDASLVSLLCHEGLKANELINLRWSDFLHERNKGTLRINGSRARAMALSARSLELLLTYRDLHAAIRHPAIVNTLEKRVFIAFKGREAATPLPVMTRHGLKFILYELGEKTGIPRLNTEQLRHFAVSYMLSLGKSPEEIMLHLGLRRIGNIAKHIVRDKASGRTRAIEGATRSVAATGRP